MSQEQVVVTGRLPLCSVALSSTTGRMCGVCEAIGAF